MGLWYVRQLIVDPKCHCFPGFRNLLLVQENLQLQATGKVSGMAKIKTTQSHLKLAVQLVVLSIMKALSRLTLIAESPNQPVPQRTIGDQ